MKKMTQIIAMCMWIVAGILGVIVCISGNPPRWISWWCLYGYMLCTEAIMHIGRISKRK